MSFLPLAFFTFSTRSSGILVRTCSSINSTMGKELASFLVDFFFSFNFSFKSPFAASHCAFFFFFPFFEAASFGSTSSPGTPGRGSLSISSLIGKVAANALVGLLMRPNFLGLLLPDFLWVFIFCLHAISCKPQRFEGDSSGMGSQEHLSFFRRGKTIQAPRFMRLRRPDLRSCFAQGSFTRWPSRVSGRC